MENIPDKIFLQIENEDADFYSNFANLNLDNNVSWCEDRVNDNDIEYVRKLNNKNSIERKPCARKADCSYIRQNGECYGIECGVYSPEG